MANSSEAKAHALIGLPALNQQPFPVDGVRPKLCGIAAHSVGHLYAIAVSRSRTEGDRRPNDCRRETNNGAAEITQSFSGQTVTPTRLREAAQASGPRARPLK